MSGSQAVACESPLSEVQTAVGLEVALPCDLMPNNMMTDKVQLVIWYREGTDKPIYTVRKQIVLPLDSKKKTIVKPYYRAWQALKTILDKNNFEHNLAMQDICGSSKE
uniref:Ig-like domain-containing protein n=1 Tax=Glossina austeni TaxID=7395 RepID=A0A1A9UND4_GLOAU